MAVSLKRLYHGQPSLAGGVVYTCPAGKTAIALSRIIANPSAVDLTVRMGVIPAGGSSDGTHYLLGDITVPARSAYESDTKVILAAGDALEAQSASLPAPTGLTATGSTTGGTLAAGTYYYRITGTNANGETVTSSEVSVTTTGSTSSVTLAWNRSLGVTGYKVYRGTAAGGELLLAAVAGGSTVTYTDTGAATSAGAMPTTGTASGCVVTISGAEL